MLGGGLAAQACEQLLKPQGIHTKWIKSPPAQVLRAGGHYLAERGGRSWSGAALLLAPRDAREAQRLLAAFGEDGLRPRIREGWGGVDTHRPGLFYCDPDHDPALVGSAAAARAVAWLGRAVVEAGLTAMVDPARCRACGTCVEICEFGAPELVETPGGRAAHIDPLVCLACGTCSAHCPSGAISLTTREAGDIASALTAMLAGGD